MAIWAWMQPVDRIWKVVTDPEKGTVQVYNERDGLVMDEKGLKRDAVSLIEENFLSIVAKRLASDGQNPVNSIENKRVPEYNPMYA